MVAGMEQLSERELKSIIARRDKRYDGRFFFGVRTTRVYCRPICPAKPKPENIHIFRSAAEAEAHGFRPCKRCRPEIAPGNKRLAGTANTVSRALRLMERVGAEIDVEELAYSVGVTGRHLRRLFDQYLGASPVEIMRTHRLHFAKQLVQGGKIPLVDVACASGFGSVRQFNAVFKERFHSTPSVMRQNSKKVSSELELRVPVRAPFDWATLLGYLARHECFGCERIVNDQYRRFIPAGSAWGTIVVEYRKEQSALAVRFLDLPLASLRPAVAAVRKLFDTDHNPAHLPKSAISPLGVRVPGGYDPFETAISIILSQLVSTTQARAKLKSLVIRFGRRVGLDPHGEVYEFPKSKILADAPVEDIGITMVRARAVRELSRAVSHGELSLNGERDYTETQAALRAIKGIGPWTAAMIAMRCLGDPDAFPRGDLIVRRALEQGIADENEWRSARAYLTHCLWRDFPKLPLTEKRGRGIL